jgi:hypothetical protein
VIPAGVRNAEVSAISRANSIAAIVLRCNESGNEKKFSRGDADTAESRAVRIRPKPCAEIALDACWTITGHTQKRSSRCLTVAERRRKHNMSNTKQKSKERTFARALGQRPFLNEARLTTTASLDLLSESFGPAERTRSGNVLFWNFVRDDGANGFSLFSRVSKFPKRGEIEVVLGARAGVKAFGEWAIDRLCGLEAGEETPLFIGAGQFVVSRLG